jgi:hypothetical protein
MYTQVSIFKSAHWFASRTGTGNPWPFWELPVFKLFENWWVWVSNPMKTGGFGFQSL